LDRVLPLLRWRVEAWVLRGLREVVAARVARRRTEGPG